MTSPPESAHLRGILTGLRFVDSKSWLKADESARQDLGIAKTHAGDVEVVPADAIKRMIDADEVREASGERDGFWFTCSTGQRDRDGDRMKQSGGSWKNFRNNPVIPWAHNYRDLPVGKAIKVVLDREGDRTRMLKQFASKENPAAEMVEAMVRGKFLRAVSIGFIPQKFEPDEKQEDEANETRVGFKINKWEGLESSVVVVPSNPGALAGAKSKGICLDPYVPLLEQCLDGEGELIWLPKTVAEKALKEIKEPQSFFWFPNGVEPGPRPGAGSTEETTITTNFERRDVEFSIKEGEHAIALSMSDGLSTEALITVRDRLGRLIKSREEQDESEGDAVVLELVGD